MPRSLDPSVGSAVPTGEINTRFIGAARKRRHLAWWLPTLIAFLAIAIFVNVVTPRFTAQTEILLEPQDKPDPATVASQVGVISSPEIAWRAIKALRLEDEAEFNPRVGAADPLTRGLVLLGVRPDPTRGTGEARVLQAFEGRLSVVASAKTRVVTIAFTSRDPKLAARGANEIAALYLRERSAAKRHVAKDEAETLATQVADLRAKLTELDAARERDRASTGPSNGATLERPSLVPSSSDPSHAPASQAQAQAHGSGKASVGTADHGEATALDRLAQSFKDQLLGATKKHEAALARQSAGTMPPDARVISSAVPPQEPSFPKKLPILVLGTLATLVLCVAWIVTRQIISDRSRDPAIGNTSYRKIATRGASPPPAMLRPAAAAAFIPSLPGQESRGLATPLRAMGGRRETEGVSTPAHPSTPANPQTGAAGPQRWGAGALAAFAGYVVAFGRPASESSGKPDSALLPKAGQFDFGWDAVAPEPRAASAGAVADKTKSRAVIDNEDVAQRIVAGHIPGRGLHVVGTVIGSDSAAFDRLIELARVLAGKGRSIIVDLNDKPAGLAVLGQAGNERKSIAMLGGLSELLAGEASFAEVIHRDHATRLHFIPTGRKEADFRDFDLILDALTETYDFVVLLTPAFPQSEIAKVMAPYADFIVLSNSASHDRNTLLALEDGLSAAGAREVLVIGERDLGPRSARGVA